MLITYSISNKSKQLLKKLRTFFVSETIEHLQINRFHCISLLIVKVLQSGTAVY
jgi:hypothetical protein